MLKKIRVVLSITIFTLITLYFVDFAEIFPNSVFHWLAAIQFVPAVLAANFIIIGSLVLLTLLFGRVYCSSICPMGVFQDIVIRLSKYTRKKKKRYKYTKEKKILRWSVLAITLIAFFSGFTLLFGLLDPYSAYARIGVNLFKPAYLGGNNLLETIFTSFGNHTFYKMDINILSVFALVAAIVTFVFVGFLAWQNGRTYCNTICPVGTVLGLLSNSLYSKLNWI